MHRVFTDPVILFCDRQNQSIKGPALYLRIPGTSPHFRIRDHSVIQPNLINKCSSPVPQQSQMKMLLCRTEQSDKDSTEKRGKVQLDLSDSRQPLYTTAAASLFARLTKIAHSPAAIAKCFLATLYLLVLNERNIMPWSPLTYS